MNRPMRRHHPIVLMLMALAALVTFELAVDALHYAPFLLLPAAALLACRRWQLHRRALGWLNGGEPHQAPRLVRGEVVGEVDDLRRQVAKLEDDAARREQLVEDLEDVAARPIEAIIASYRLRQQQYGPAAVGKPGRRP